MLQGKWMSNIYTNEKMDNIKANNLILTLHVKKMKFKIWPCNHILVGFGAFVGDCM